MKKRIEKLIEDKLTKEDEKSLRDVAFLRSLGASFAKWGSLTEKQTAAIERMEHLASPAGMEEVAQWTRDYRKNHAKTAKSVSLYYLKNTYYFRDICLKVVSEPSYVPTKRQFQALTENKFAKKVIRELQRPPTYGKGDLVRVREGNTVPLSMYPLRGRLCIVIDNNLTSIQSHAVGSKEYRVLPFGSTDTIVCQERHIKSMRKKAK